MTQRSIRIGLRLAAIVIVGFAGLRIVHTAWADDDAPTQPSAEDVIRQLEGQARENPLIEPTRPLMREQTPGSEVQTDPRVLGVAPGQAKPTLRREGEFIVNRRGRIKPAGGAQVGSLFVFEADSQANPEPPMHLLPCQMLQSMEDLATERGHSVIFVLSGQVFTYRGANYLLPTMMKIAIESQPTAAAPRTE